MKFVTCESRKRNLAVRNRAAKETENDTKIPLEHHQAIADVIVFRFSKYLRSPDTSVQYRCLSYSPFAAAWFGYSHFDESAINGFSNFRIEIQSAPMQGTTLYIELPLIGQDGASGSDETSNP